MQNRTIQPNYEGLKYSGSAWVSASSSSNGCEIITCFPGDSVSFSFTGTAIYYLYTPATPKDAVASFTLDDTEAVVDISPSPFDSPDATCSQDILFHRDGLQNINHTITATLQGGSSSTLQSCLTFTGFMVTTNQNIGVISVSTTESPNVQATNTNTDFSFATPPPVTNSNPDSAATGKGSSLSTGVIIGIVCGAVGGLIIISSLIWLLHRYRSSPGIVNFFGSSITHIGRDQSNISNDKHFTNTNSNNRRSTRNVNSHNTHVPPNYWDNYEPQ